ncbi:MAG: hypothetical protein E7265_02095 [Lachnospiraceae bacterium]|nr:hypothetical protein [Lachnospiraceae bacterium]
MGKIHFIFDEFFRSFQKGIINNILLMIMFSICITMTVLMSSYYLDLGERTSDSVSNYDEDGTWYNIRFEGQDWIEVEKSFETAKDSQKVMDYYKEVYSIPSHPVMSINTIQQILLIEEECDKYIPEDKVRMFEPQDFPGGSFGAKIDGVDEEYRQFKAIHCDTDAYEYFGFKTVKGEGITRDNTTLNSPSDELPVVLGSSYSEFMDVGTKLRIAIDGTDYLFNCKVVGILEQGSKVYNFGSSGQGLMSLDSHIIFPCGINLNFETTDNNVLARYAYVNYHSLETCQMMFHYNTEFREIAELFSQIGDKYNLPPMSSTGSSMGQRLFRKEAVGNIRIMLIISICLVCFTLFSLFLIIHNKIKNNQEIYGIYLMNGCSTSMITIPFMMEIAAIIIPSLILGKCIFGQEMSSVYFNADVIINAVYMVVLAAYLLGVAFLVCIMRGVDTEKLIKNGE